MALVFESVVTLIFWTMLYKYVADIDQGFLWNFLVRSQHTVPFGVLFIDFWLNSCVYELRFLWVELTIIFLYGMVNLVVTKVSGLPVYPPMSWDSVTSVLIALGCIPLAAIFAIIFYYLSKCKHKVFGQKDDGFNMRKSA